MIVRTARLALLATMLAATIPFVASGQGAPSTTVVPTDGAIEALRPGQYFWAPQLAPEGPVMVIVSLTTQRAYAYRNGVPIGV